MKSVQVLFKEQEKENTMGLFKSSPRVSWKLVCEGELVSLL